MAAVVERSPADTSKAMTQGGNPNDFPLTPARAQEVVQFLDHDDFDELANHPRREFYGVSVCGIALLVDI
jgi:hypothetical protein